MALTNHGGVIYPGSHSALNFTPMLYAELLPYLAHLSQVCAPSAVQRMTVYPNLLSISWGQA